MNKPNITRIINKIKAGVKTEKIATKIKGTVKTEKTFPKVTLTGTRLDIEYRERDMRQEAIDIGSHQAREYLGGNDAGTV